MKLGFEDFEIRCKEIGALIKSNKNIKDIYGVPKGGLIPATRIAYLAEKPITFIPTLKHTVIIDACIDSGATRHSFDNFSYFFALIDKNFEDINEHIDFWWMEE